MDVLWLRMPSLFSKEMLAYYKGCFIQYLVVNFVVCPHPPWPSMPFCQQVRLTHSHSISKWHPEWRRGTGSAKHKWFEMLKSSRKVYEKQNKKTLDYLWSINYINVCIRGYKCHQTAIESSNVVYIASMGVKIEHTVGVQNRDFSKCISFLPFATTKVKIAKIYAFVRRN